MMLFGIFLFRIMALIGTVYVVSRIVKYIHKGWKARQLEATMALTLEDLARVQKERDDLLESVVYLKSQQK